MTTPAQDLRSALERIRIAASGRDAIPKTTAGKEAHRNVCLALTGLLGTIERDAREALALAAPATDEPVGAEEWAGEWHRVVQMTLMMMGLPTGMGASEALAAVHEHFVKMEEPTNLATPARTDDAAQAGGDVALLDRAELAWQRFFYPAADNFTGLIGDKLPSVDLEVADCLRLVLAAMGRHVVPPAKDIPALFTPTEPEALAACPFCGGEAERFTIKDEGDNFGGDVVCCKECGASSHVEFGRKENLVSCWNRRTPAARMLEGEGLTVVDAWQDLVDKDDRTSPEEYPDMALITREELADYMTAAIAHPAIRSLSDDGEGG